MKREENVFKYLVGILVYLIVTMAVGCIASCSYSGAQYNKSIDKAEDLMDINADSALSLLDAVDLSELKEDSIRAKYVYLKAYGHLKKNRSMISDSLISYAHNYYRGKDKVRDVRSGIAFAWYRFWTGDTPGAISLLDSLASMSGVSDSLKIQALRIRVYLGVAEYQGAPLIPFAKRLYAPDRV